MWLIVGLGNPGPKYELTRHNFGFLAIDALLHVIGVDASNHKTSFGAHVYRGDIAGTPCVVLKPQSFMNRSGTSVQAAMAFHKISLENVLVLHDELDVPLGEIRIKRGGGAGGHNGIKDITRLIGPDFLRVRLGIGRPNIKGTEADFVLHPFKEQEFTVVEEIIEKSVVAVKTLIIDGLDVAQARCQIRLEKSP